jgi:hypothetical protein
MHISWLASVDINDWWTFQKTSKNFRFLKKYFDHGYKWALGLVITIFKRSEPRKLNWLSDIAF